MEISTALQILDTEIRQMEDMLSAKRIARDVLKNTFNGKIKELETVKTELQQIKGQKNKEVLPPSKTIGIPSSPSSSLSPSPSFSPSASPSLSIKK